MFSLDANLTDISPQSGTVHRCVNGTTRQKGHSPENAFSTQLSGWILDFSPGGTTLRRLKRFDRRAGYVRVQIQVSHRPHQGIHKSRSPNPLPNSESNDLCWVTFKAAFGSVDFINSVHRSRADAKKRRTLIAAIACLAPSAAAMDLILPL